MLRVAIVSGSPLVRAGLRAALEGTGGFEVTAMARTMVELPAGAETALDVIVSDAEDLADDNAADGGSETGPPLVLLLGQEEGSPGEWLAEGTTLLPCDAPAEVVAAAAAAAAAGLVATSRELMSEALRFARPPASATSWSHEALTMREMQVLERLAQGLGNKAIGEALHISTHTAKFHVAQIIANLDATSRAHAVAKALRAGLLQA